MSLFGSISKRSKRRPAWILAGLLVLVAQTVSAVHELDPESQTPEHVCEVCVASASADAANIGEFSIVVPVYSDDFSFSQIEAVAVATTLALPPSRGPPAIS
jgi:hypothetical protein